MDACRGREAAIRRKRYYSACRRAVTTKTSIMNSHTIEVFVEPGCKSCDTVISLVRSLAREQRLVLRIFDRERDARVFLDRNIVVCPATFVNNHLAFYGEFTEEAMRKHIRP